MKELFVVRVQGVVTPFEGELGRDPENKLYPMHNGQPVVAFTSIKEEDRDAFLLRSGSIISNLPQEYKDKVIKGESFQIEVTETKIITFNS